MVADGGRVAARDRRLAIVLATLTTLGSLLMRWGVPINPTSLDHEGFDGGLFERLAVSLAHHDWLGPLNIPNRAIALTEPLALAKGPAYSLFMAFTYRLHVPLQVGEQLVYLFGAATIAGAIFVVTKRPLAAVVAYAVLAFDPVNFSAISTQLTRENLYSGLALGFVGGFFLVVWGALFTQRRWLVAIGAAVTGLCGGAFWLTREEGVWVLSALGLIVVGLAAIRVRDLRLAARLALVVVIVGVGLAVPVSVVRTKNAHVYGVRLTTDFAEGTFPQAYAAWSRVRGVELRAFVPINKAQRLAVYRVSPAARELRPRLEDPTNGWRKWGCESNGVCDDFAGGGEPWAIREAAYMAGEYNNEKTAQVFFGRVARDIDRGCANGRLTCSRHLPPTLQLVQRASARDVLASATRWLGRLPFDAAVFRPYGVSQVNETTKADLDTIRHALRETPKTPAGARARAAQFEKRRAPYLLDNVVYMALFGALLVLSTIGVVMLVFRKQRPASFALIVLSFGLLSAVAVRLVLFGVIATTQYFSLMRYQLVARTFLLAAAIVLAQMALDQPWALQLRGRVRGWRH